jgi:hypothetical protein
MGYAYALKDTMVLIVTAHANLDGIHTISPALELAQEILYSTSPKILASNHVQNQRIL